MSLPYIALEVLLLGGFAAFGFVLGWRNRGEREEFAAEERAERQRGLWRDAGELDLAPIQKRLAAATTGPWGVASHAHLEVGCRCGSDYDEPTGWYVDHDKALCCDDVAGEGKASCGEGPFLPYADAVFAAYAREDVPALISEVERLRFATKGADQ
ncbi:MAG TPA: hypothetical protein VHA75_18315 [Rugosimonospora sp.]|nr:hypothetical protein [Rugosimonospora sp.]